MIMVSLRDFRIGWRLLVKEPAYSAVVILGLTVGFAVCYLLLGLVRHSLAYDAHVPQRESIYRVMGRWNMPDSDGKWGDNLSLPGHDAAINSGTPVLVTTFITRQIDVRQADKVQTISLSVVDPDFEKIFQPKVIAGDLHAALTRPDAIALTRETAQAVFGPQEAVGKSLLVAGKPYLVAAVVADPPSATTLPYSALAGIKTSIWDEEYRKLVTTNWGSSHGPTYVKLLPGADPAAVTGSIKRSLLASAFYQRILPQAAKVPDGRELVEFKLGPLSDAYLDPDVHVRNTNPHADRQTIFGLAAVALLILLLAATNYVNLATVRTLRRQREIAVRKVLGASAGAVSRQFLAESILVCLIATGMGLVLAWLLLPVFSELVQRKLDTMFTPAALGASVVLGVVLGLAAGAYPTWSALRVRASSALSGRGNSETAGGLWLRRMLTVLQFATAMGLTGMTLAVTWQTRYASSLDPGFNPLPLLQVSTSGDMRSASVRSFRDALARIPGVRSVTAADASVTVNRNSTGLRRDGGDQAEISFLLVDPVFFETYGLAPLEGRLYNPRQDKIEDEDKVVINAAAARRLGFASPQAAIGKYLRFNGSEGVPMQVIGVAPDIRHRSAREQSQSTAYFLDNRAGVLTVRVDGDMEAVMREVEAMWPRFFPNDVLDMKRVAGLFGQSYADDLRLAKLLGASSIIAIAIAAFGMYVLAAYSVQRRTREIVLRKLHGAGSRAIAALVAREFGALIGVGALIGLPAAWLATERYLAPFTERAPIGLWTIGAALAVAALVAFGSTLRHALVAMRMAPALALRD
jgi:putative ABC transport system permease protein